MGGERQGSRGEAWHAMLGGAVAAALDSPPEGRTEQGAADRLARGLPPPVLEVGPQAALRLLLEGVLRHSAECV